MSARRREREALPEGTVPVRLRRFRQEEWPEDGEGEWVEDVLAAHRAWREARRAWAAANGYLPHARVGEAPGRDWRAFLTACSEG